jgi:hypothetical protein
MALPCVQVDDTRQFNAVRKSFVDRCMERLQLAHQQITLGENVPNAQNQIDRLIFMLKVRALIPPLHPCFLPLAY